MSTRDYAKTVLDSLDESRLMDFLQLFADDNTLALVESEMIAQNVNPDRKRYRSFQELLDEVKEELDNE